MNYEMNYSSTSLGEEIERGERKRKNVIMRKRGNKQKKKTMQHLCPNQTVLN